jgi:HK97 family phage prohead protease
MKTGVVKTYKVPYRLTKVYGLTGTVDSTLPSISLSTSEEGTFEAMAAVFLNTDLQGDRIVPGAFLRSIEKWRASGLPLPIIWQHDWSDPFANVGYANPYDIREVQPGEDPRVPNGGLYIRGHFDLDKPFAKQVYDLVKAGRVAQWSFSYTTLKERRAGDGSNELVELEILEAGPCLAAANPETLTLDVKAANAIPTAVVTGDGRLRCSNCGKFSRIEMRPRSVFSAETVFVGTCGACGALQGFSPKSWGPAKNAAALAEIRGRAVWNILMALRDGGAPTEVMKSAVESGRRCLDDPDGYPVAEYAAGVREIVDAVVDDEYVQADSLADRDIKSRLDDLVSTVSVGFGSKPWRVIERDDGRFCVQKITDNSIVDCHDTREAAEAQVRALYASEKSAPPVQRSAQDLELLAQIDALEGVGTKRIHRSPNEDNLADLAHHVLRDHGNQLQRDAVLRMNLRELQAAHRAAHALQGEPGITSTVSDDVSTLNPKAVNALLDDLEYGAKGVAEARAQEARDAADREVYEQAQHALLSGPIDWQAQDDRDRERQQRDLEEIARRDRERAAVADHVDVIDESRRGAHDWRQSGAANFYTESIGAEPQPRSKHVYPEPRITEAVPNLGETYRLPTRPQERQDGYRLEPEPTARVEGPVPEPIGPVPTMVTDSPLPLVVKEEHFQIPARPQELAATVEAQPPRVPAPAQTVAGEVIRLRAGGEVLKETHATRSDDGEVIRIAVVPKPDENRRIVKEGDR